MADNTYNFTGLSSNVSIGINGPETVLGEPNMFSPDIPNSPALFEYVNLATAAYTKLRIYLRPGAVNGVYGSRALFDSSVTADPVNNIYLNSVDLSAGMVDPGIIKDVWSLSDLINLMPMTSGPYNMIDDNTVEITLPSTYDYGEILTQPINYQFFTVDNIPGASGLYETHVFPVNGSITLTLDGLGYEFLLSNTLPPPDDLPLIRRYYVYDDGVDFKPNMLAKLSLILNDYTVNLVDDDWDIQAKAVGPNRMIITSDVATSTTGSYAILQKQLVVMGDLSVESNLINDTKLVLVKNDKNYVFLITDTVKEDSVDGFTRFIYIERGDDLTSVSNKVISKLNESGFNTENVTGAPGYPAYVIQVKVSAEVPVTNSSTSNSLMSVTETIVENVTPENGHYTFTEPEVLSILQLGSVIKANDIEFIKTDYNKFIRADGLEGVENNVSVGIPNLKFYGEFQKICYKDGGIQRTPESVEQPCMTLEGQVGPKIRTRYGLATTLNMALNYSFPTKLMIASALRGSWESSESYTAPIIITNLGFNNVTGLYDYLIPTNLAYISKGKFFMISNHPNPRLNGKPLLCSSKSGGVRFSHMSNVSSIALEFNANIKVFSHIHNGTNVISYTLTQVNNGIGYYIRLPGCLTKSFEISSTLADMISFNTTVDGVGGYESNPNLTDTYSHPYHSYMVDSGNSYPTFTGSNSIIYLNGKVFPVSEFSFRTGDLVATDYTNSGVDDLTDTSGEYPSMINLNSFSGISGTTKGFLSRDIIQQIEKFNNNCTGELILRGSSAPVCQPDGTNKRDEFIIHIPKVTIVATVDNPAANTPTAVSMEYSAAFSPDYGYTVSINHYGWED